MFGFKLWSNFGSFRDPITITQNLTFPVPPKTTIGGALASILGINYKDYFEDENYFDFLYSLVLINPVRKTSFAQNYIADYTAKSEVKYSVIEKYYKAKYDVIRLQEEEKYLKELEKKSKSEEIKHLRIKKKIEEAQNDLGKKQDKLLEIQGEQFHKPKPIYRELLINPKYFVFIKNFKYEGKIKEYLQSHKSSFALYMGNSEFAANYDNIELQRAQVKSDRLDSFTKHNQLIKFEPGKKYTNMYAATKSYGNRQYKDYQNLVICDKVISLKQKIETVRISCKYGDFNCDFI